MKKFLPEVDLTSLYQPVLHDGAKSICDFEDRFLSLQKGFDAFSQQGLCGYAQLPFQTDILDEVLACAEPFQNVQNIVVLGIGGSALGAQSLWYALNGGFSNLNASSPRFFVIDHIEPCAFFELQKLVDNPQTIFVVISKSGNTSETLAQYRFVKEHFQNITSKNFVVITDPKNGCLRDLATQQNLKMLSVPQNIGGRFSVLTAVGLLPLALAGVNVRDLLAGAKAMQKVCNEKSLQKNPAALIATSWHYWLQDKGFSQVVMMPYSDRLRYFSDWFAQLFGESLGKKTNANQHIGFTPIKATGVTDQHSQLQLYLDGPRDKLICFLNVNSYEDSGFLGNFECFDERIDFLKNQSLEKLMKAEQEATLQSLLENNRPTHAINIQKINEYELGQLYQLFMNVIPFLGALLKINPFDQPAVEQIKVRTFKLMERKGFDG